MHEDDVLKAGVMTGLEDYTGGQVSLNVIKNVSLMDQGYYKSKENNYYEAGAGVTMRKEVGS
ncbi:MAG: hypothetical protein A3H98_14495 [Bacteroidetes bacterium RIFCSPLOWO2_02_FULL_36_8]|nr:MAG: hypothetical protein A3H98_14495 [Bacteroidetes bacterium RIFCSPLOWO2_02_FULL_36_8]OFY71839.1 MAG: hypothetical protein A3G23_04750 [Bacteroidetes bacterium RIFCSPLOWO2_12_FULL_37_12]